MRVRSVPVRFRLFSQAGDQWSPLPTTSIDVCRGGHRPPALCTISINACRGGHRPPAGDQRSPTRITSVNNRRGGHRPPALRTISIDVCRGGHRSPALRTIPIDVCRGGHRPPVSQKLLLHKEAFYVQVRQIKSHNGKVRIMRRADKESSDILRGDTVEAQARFPLRPRNVRREEALGAVRS